LAEGIILHLSRSGVPLEVEVLDASKIIQSRDPEVSFEGVLPAVARNPRGHN